MLNNYRMDLITVYNIFIILWNIYTMFMDYILYKALSKYNIPHIYLFHIYIHKIYGNQFYNIDTYSTIIKSK